MSKASSTSIDLTPEEIEEKQRQTQATLKRIAAADTLQEQQRVGNQVWAEMVERPHAADSPRVAAHPAGPGHREAPRPGGEDDHAKPRRSG
jgi:hypothetical protein